MRESGWRTRRGASGQRVSVELPSKAPIAYKVAWAPVNPFRRNRSAAGPRSPPARREATGEILFNNKTDSFMSCYSHVEHNKLHRHGRSQYITRTLILDDKTRRTLLSAPSATNAALDRC